MADRKRKRMVQQQPDRRANRTILVRTLFLLTLFGVAAFVPLLVRLWQIQIRDYDKYQGMAVEQQTADSTVEANRGTIYDRSGETLAMSATVYNIQLSPKEILACQEAYREKAANAAENGEDTGLPGAHQRVHCLQPGPAPGSGRGGHPQSPDQDQLHV